VKIKFVTHRGPAEGTHARTGTTAIPVAVPTLSSREKHSLIFGVLRLWLGVLQMVFAATAIVCLLFVGISSATVICIAIATAATLVSWVLFHRSKGVRPQRKRAEQTESSFEAHTAHACLHVF
jgi:hypothetical protein